MFSPKSNNASPSNAAQNAKDNGPFIKPDMKTISPDAKKEEGGKDHENKE